MAEKSGLPFVTLPIVRELLETQERCFKATMQMLIDSIREEVDRIACGILRLSQLPGGGGGIFIPHPRKQC